MQSIYSNDQSITSAGGTHALYARERGPKKRKVVRRRKGSNMTTFVITSKEVGSDGVENQQPLRVSEQHKNNQLLTMPMNFSVGKGSSENDETNGESGRSSIRRKNVRKCTGKGGGDCKQKALVVKNVSAKKPPLHPNAHVFPQESIKEITNFTSSNPDNFFEVLKKMEASHKKGDEIEQKEIGERHEIFPTKTENKFAGEKLTKTQ